MKANYKKILLYIAVAVLMVTVMVKMLGDGFREVITKLASMQLWCIPLIIMCALMYMVFEGIAIWLITKTYKADFPLGVGLQAGLYTGVFRAATFGLGSAAALIFYLNGKKVAPEVGYGITTVSYSFHKIAVAVSATLFMVFNFDFFRLNYGEYFKFIIIGYGVTLVIVMVLLAVCLWKKFHKVLMFLLKKIVGKTRLSSLIMPLEQRLTLMQKETGKILKTKNLAFKMLCVQLIKISFWYLIPYISFKAMGAAEGLTLVKAMGIIALVVSLVGVLPSPGNVGTTEVLFALLFQGVVGEIAARAGMVIYRFSTYYVAFFVALFVLGVIKVVKRARNTM